MILRKAGKSLDQRGASTVFQEQNIAVQKAQIAGLKPSGRFKEKIRELDPDYRIPRVPRDSDPSQSQLDVFEAAASVQSSLAVKQFISLVYEWRRRDERMFLSSDTGDILLQHGKRLAAVIGRSSPSKFRCRYAQACVARELDRRQKKSGSIRRSKEGTEWLAQQLGMKIEELKMHLQDGKIWNSICGPEDDGLLPFLLLDSKWPLFVKKKKWKSMIAKRKMSAFHSLLDAEYVKNLRRAGRTFEEMI
ncbi:hypothetical protein DER46DRAFT_650676 [Fusarium sp. MPI-SDFR-AT-0072]|nr:hypothetical protein DER46DRAFT_650676 [Fusarium sp. MPI-SDFR-AT-0072]